MKKYILSIIPLVLLCGCSSPTRTLPSGQAALIFGVYTPGHNVTEPKPQKSEYLETRTGGVVVLQKGAGLFLKTRVLKQPEHELYITVEYENPLGGAPLMSEAAFRAGVTGLNFSVPDIQAGLKSYADYTITVRIWASKGAAMPMDTLVQKVRSYVDTTGTEPVIFDKLGSQS